MKVHHLISTLFLGALLVSCNQSNPQKDVSISDPDGSETQTREASDSATTSNETSTIASNESAAEAFYQEILAQHGQNCYECAEDLDPTIESNDPTTPVEAGASAESENRNRPKQLNVVIALDSSGSMAEVTEGEPRLTAAKKAISEFVNSLPEQTQVSLVAFGHQGSNASKDKATSCAGIETVYSLAKRDQNRFQSAVDSFSPRGYTPLADTLEHVNTELSAYTAEQNQNVIYLVSDGVETCDGNPETIASNIHGSETELIVNVIGFAVDNTAQAQLQNIAKAGGGEYFTANNATELQQVWKKNRQNLDGYRLNNTNQQNSAFLSLTNVQNKLSLCVKNKLNKERLDVTSALNRLRLKRDPNAQYIDYVQEQQANRRERIETWLDQLAQDIENKRDITIDQLKQDLKAVEEQNE